MKDVNRELNIALSSDEKKQEVKKLLKKYHPDTPITGDANKFIYIQNHIDTLEKAIGKIDNTQVNIKVKDIKPRIDKTFFVGKDFSTELSLQNIYTQLKNILDKYQEDIRVELELINNERLNIYIMYLGVRVPIIEKGRIDFKQFMNYIKSVDNVKNECIYINNLFLNNTKYKFDKSLITIIEPVIKFYIGKNDIKCETKMITTVSKSKISEYLEQYVNNEIELMDIPYEYFVKSFINLAYNKKDIENLDKYLKKNKASISEWKEFVEVEPEIILLKSFRSKDKKIINSALVKKPYLFYLDEFKNKFPNFKSFVKSTDIQISKLINLLLDKNSNDRTLIELIYNDDFLRNITKKMVSKHLNKELINKFNKVDILLYKVVEILKSSKYNGYTKLISQDILKRYSENPNLDFASMALKAILNESVSKINTLKILDIVNPEDILFIYNELYNSKAKKIPKKLLRKDIDFSTTTISDIV